MYLNRSLSHAIRYALFVSAGAGLTLTAYAADESEPIETTQQADKALERIQVTGSRIQRADLEGALPVTVISREDIELSGETSAAELIRQTTFNTAGSGRPVSGSTAQGVSNVDMRGLGAGRTLVLVDGRRLTMSPSTGSSQDLNSIPMGAIERIEILSDGASAVYGSDAIGGVINIITRKDFNGAELTLGRAEVSVPKSGGDRENGSLVFGAAGDSTRVIGGVSWNSRDIIYERDFPWVEAGASTKGNNWRTIIGQNEEGENIYGKTYYGVPNGCRDEDFYEEAGQCRYNFNATNAKEASTSNESLFTKVTHDINANWSLYANASIAKTESFGRYAPAPDNNGKYSFNVGVDSYNNPTNPNAWFYDKVNNPHAVDYTWEDGPMEVDFHHRFAAMGNRDTTVSNENIDLLVGVEGQIGQLDVDFGVRRVRNKSVEIGEGYLAAKTAWDNVNNFNPGYCADGRFDLSCRYGYDIQSPGANPEDVLAAGVVTISRLSEFNIDEIYGSVGFEVMDIDAGTIQGFVGLERRDEYYTNQFDSQSEAGLVGGSAGSSSGGDRTVDAAYFEFLVPVTYDLELSLAGRYDDYSDYGGDFSPKVGVRYQPTPEWMLRASWGKGFRAPNLKTLTQKKSYSADSIRDPETCAILAGDPTKTCQVDGYSIANPDLDSEKSTQIALGTAYQAATWMNFSADYYQIEIKDRIRSFSASELLKREQSGDFIPSGLGVKRDEDGIIQSITRGYGNEGTLKTSGLDLNVRTSFDLGEYGRIRNNLQLAQVFTYKTDGERNTVKDPGLPKQRLSFQNQWDLGDYTIAWTTHFIGTQYTQVFGRDEQGNFPANMACQAPTGEADVVRCGNVGGHTTHDVQFNYQAPWQGKLTLGVQNLFEKLPKIAPRDGAEYADGSRDYNMDLYDSYGRVIYIRYSQKF